MNPKTKARSSLGPIKEEGVNASPAAADFPNNGNCSRLRLKARKKEHPQRRRIEHKEAEDFSRKKSQQQRSGKAKRKDQSMITDLPDIHLEYEDRGGVLIYDTCDDIRRKINDHLRKIPNASQSLFVRDLSTVLCVSV